ncbi:hypothetical protein [Nocardia brasiliensis]
MPAGAFAAATALGVGLAGLILTVAGTNPVTGASAAAQPDIPCEQWQQLHPGWPCIPVPKPPPPGVPTGPPSTPSTQAPLPGQPQTQQPGGYGPNVGAVIPPDPGPGNGVPIVPVPGAPVPALPGNPVPATPYGPPAGPGEPTPAPQAPVPAVPPSVTPGQDLVSQLERAARLHKQGLLSDKEFADLKGQLLHGVPVDPVTPSPKDDNQHAAPRVPDRRIPLLLVLAAVAFTAPALRIGRNPAGRAVAAARLTGPDSRGKAFGTFDGLIRQVDNEDQSNDITIAEPFGGVGDSYTVHLLPDRRVDGVTIYQDGKVIVETLFQQDGSWLVWVDDNSYYRIEEDGTVHKLIPSTGEVLRDNVDYASELANKLKLSNLQKMLALLGALAGGLPNRQLPPGFGPGVVPKPDPPGTSPVPGYSYSNNYGTDNFGITAEVDQNGVLDYVIEAGPDSPVKGSQMFEDMWNAVGPNVTAINGTWVNKPREGVVTNLQSFNNAIADGATPQQAAFSTFAGKMAFRHGFRFVEITKLKPEGPGPYTDVEVTFTR